MIDLWITIKETSDYVIKMMQYFTYLFDFIISGSLWMHSNVRVCMHGVRVYICQ